MKKHTKIFESNVFNRIEMIERANTRINIQSMKYFQKKGGQEMKAHRRKVIVMAIAVVFIVLSSISFASATEYEAMREDNSVKVFFDMRDGIPKIAAVHLKLINDTYNQLTAMGKKPDFVVVFIASAVKLISNNRSEFSTEELKYLKEMDDHISEMIESGINLEVCLAAVDYFEVDPASIRTEIKQVANGWISEIGYQAKGYSLVPVY